MGYKLAGYNVLGCNEIDPEMIGAYRENHKPQFSFLSPIQEFKNTKEFPPELMNLDILDGSPPCSSFSMAGSREKKWGVKKKFREGQAEQVLDDLFFDFLDLAERLQPKVIIAENVKGMLMGNARSYVKKIQKRYQGIGYDVQLFMFNAATMGVPQKRERVFFIGSKRELGWPKLNLKFNEPAIPFGEVLKVVPGLGKTMSDAFYKWWVKCPKGKSLSVAHPKGSFFNSHKLSYSAVVPTITATGGAKHFHPDHPNEITDEQTMACGSYPQDYKFPKSGAKYLVGMSVPPVMTAQIASKIYEQWFSRSDS